MARGSTKGMLPLAILGGRVIRWLSPLDARLLAEAKERAARWRETDWTTSVEDIAIESAMWHQPIEFSGDTRAFIEHQRKSARKKAA
jgi:hypothetical protein